MKKLAAVAVCSAIFVGGAVLGVRYADYFRAKPAPVEIKVDLDRILAPRAAPIDLEDVNFNDYWLAWQLIKSRHVNASIKDKELFYGAMQGMVRSLKDPHSAFFTPEEVQSNKEDMDSAFFGIGATLEMKDEQIVITATMPGSPAEKAGIREGDMILEINGESVEGLTLYAAVKKIRGQEGTEVKLQLWRKGLKEPYEVSVIRGEVKVESVKWKMIAAGQKHFAVITITGFHSDTIDLFDKAVGEVLSKKPDGLILDLRNNPGGWLHTAVKVSSAWIEGRKPVVETRPRYGEPEVALSTGAARLADMPTVVLVNKHSASASEIVAGCLQDYGKARLIGETTYGKGSGQQEFKLSDGSVLHLTTFLWYTPSGRSIQKAGIVPDETVTAVPEDLKKKKDAQMSRAIQYLLKH